MNALVRFADHPEEHPIIIVLFSSPIPASSGFMVLLSLPDPHCWLERLEPKHRHPQATNGRPDVMVRIKRSGKREKKLMQPGGGCVLIICLPVQKIKMICFLAVE